MKIFLLLSAILVVVNIAQADKHDKYSKKANVNEFETYNSDFR